MTCSVPSKTWDRDKPLRTSTTLTVPRSATWTGTQPSASRESQPTVSSPLIETWLSRQRPTALTRFASLKTRIELSDVPRSESTSHSNRCAPWLTTPTMVTSLRLSIFCSHLPRTSWASRRPTSRWPVTERLSRLYLNPSATVTRWENSTRCTTRPRKFATRQTIW